MNGGAEDIECVEITIHSKDGTKKTTTLSKVTSIDYSETVEIEARTPEEVYACDGFVHHEPKPTGERTWTITGKEVDEKGLHPK